MSVTYSTFGGRIISENRGGVIRDYVSDPLGNTVALVDDTGAITDRWEYWPYGEVASRTGTNATPFTFIGALGYFKDLVSRIYVRARMLRTDLTQWLTQDPLWPKEQAYRYVGSGPNQLVDPMGTDNDYSDCDRTSGVVRDHCCANQLRFCLSDAAAWLSNVLKNLGLGLTACIAFCNLLGVNVICIVGCILVFGAEAVLDHQAYEAWVDECYKGYARCVSGVIRISTSGIWA